MKRSEEFRIPFAILHICKFPHWLMLFTMLSMMTLGISPNLPSEERTSIEKDAGLF
jgi:hypothetical protein